MWSISAYESAKSRWLRYSPPSSLWFSKSSHRNMLSSACCREQLGRYGISLSYSSPDVDLVAFFVYVDCHRAVGVDFLHKFDVHIFYPLFLKRGQYCLSLHWVESFLVVDECDAEWNIIFYALLLQLVYNMDMICRWVSASGSSLLSTFVSTS